MMYGIQKRARGGVVIAQQSCNSIATVWAVQVGGRKERTIDSRINDSKTKNIL